MDKNVYMHSINHTTFNSKREIKKLESIIKSGYLYSLDKQGYKYSRSYSGLDYISLCDYTKKNITNDNLLYYNSFYGYIRLGLSLAFNKDIIDEKYDVISPEILSASKYDKVLRYYMPTLGLHEKRYSDLPDEVQIKDHISLSDLSYITYPCKEYLLNKTFTRKENKAKSLIHQINELKKVLNNYDYNLDIFDIDSGILLDEEGVSKVLKLNSIDKRNR